MSTFSNYVIAVLAAVVLIGVAVLLKRSRAVRRTAETRREDLAVSTEGRWPAPPEPATPTQFRARVFYDSPDMSVEGVGTAQSPEEAVMAALRLIAAFAALDGELRRRCLLAISDGLPGPDILLGQHRIALVGATVPLHDGYLDGYGLPGRDSYAAAGARPIGDLDPRVDYYGQWGDPAEQPGSADPGSAWLKIQLPEGHAQITVRTVSPIQLAAALQRELRRPWQELRSVEPVGGSVALPGFPPLQVVVGRAG